MYFDLSIPSQLAGALLPDLILVIGAMLLLLFAVWGPETMGRARATGILTIAVCVGVVRGGRLALARRRRRRAPESLPSMRSAGPPIASCSPRRSSPPR